MVQFSVGILTVSDSCANGSAIDKSGPKLHELVTENFTDVSHIEYKIVADDSMAIETSLIYFCDVLKLNLVLTTGGTGFSQRDVTPEATRKIIQREAPQLTLALSLASLQKTKFAVLSRAVCGIRNVSLIINLPGSEKAVTECFESVRDVIPHAIALIVGDDQCVKDTHVAVQSKGTSKNVPHICPHKTGTGAPDDRNSPFPMISVDSALDLIFKNIQSNPRVVNITSPINIPEFRASIKDGYALKSCGGKGIKHVIAYISAGDPIHHEDFKPNECFKINTGAAVPDYADAVIQVEDTCVYRTENGQEKVVEMLIDPIENLDIRPIGCDLAKGDRLFPSDSFPDIVPYYSLLASIGRTIMTPHDAIGITIISTGDELTQPNQKLEPGKIFDSNTTMLKALLKQHGFNSVTTVVAGDSFDDLRETIEKQSRCSKIIITSGGVSMGDKDFLKNVLEHLGYETHFGRVNMKPGKPMTFATNKLNNAVFGLPGNPVSAFATFNLFVLPALRKCCGYDKHTWSLARINVELLHDSLELDPRPEYARAKIISKNGKLYGELISNQMSSRLGSIAGADVLLHLPGATKDTKKLKAGTILPASILKQHFISEYK